jgi:hypothetical protein
VRSRRRAPLFGGLAWVAMFDTEGNSRRGQACAGTPVRRRGDRLARPAWQSRA